MNFYACITLAAAVQVESKSKWAENYHHLVDPVLCEGNEENDYCDGTWDCIDMRDEFCFCDEAQALCLNALEYMGEDEWFVEDFMAMYGDLVTELEVEEYADECGLDMFDDDCQWYEFEDNAESCGAYDWEEFDASCCEACP